MKVKEPTDKNLDATVPVQDNAQKVTEQTKTII